MNPSFPNREELPPFPLAAEPKVSALVGEIISDVQKLVRQELSLAKVEVTEEWEKTKTVALGFTAAAAAAVAAVILFGLAVAFVLVEVGLPVWLAYALTAAAFGGGAYVLYSRAVRVGKEIDFMPRQAVETVKENVKWIRNHNS